MDRLSELGVQQLRLPLGASKSEKHVSILVSEGIKDKKHVILLFPERHVDSGILSYRMMGEESINKGSIVDFVKSVLRVGTGDEKLHSFAVPSNRPADIPGIVIANPSQLIWFRGGSRTVTDREWVALPRKSPIYGPMRIDEEKNRIEGNHNFEQHIQYIFEHVLQHQENELQICDSEAKISIIGQEYVGSTALQYLASNWHIWRSRITCVALVNPQHKLDDLFAGFDLSIEEDRQDRGRIEDFIARRTRAYRLSQRPFETHITGRDRFGCNVYAAGETLYEESCFVRCWPSILDWIDICRVSGTYSEPSQVNEMPDEEDASPKSRTYQRKILNEAEAEQVGYHTLDIGN